MKPENITITDWDLLQKKYPDHLNEIVAKLKEHYPVQYLIGDVEFLNTTINVDERVLIPRFETELLVEKIIEKIKIMNLDRPSILDLGTGSGCISIALKKNIDCEVTGVDISANAITLAKQNALLNDTKIEFKVADMVTFDYAGFNVIVSNPPYVSEKEPVGPETKYEPQNALFAQNQGLYFYEKIIEKISKLTSKPRLVAFEIGMTQKTAVESFAQKYLDDYNLYIEKDLTNRDRYVFLTFE